MALDACFENLKRLNDELSEKYVLLGNGLKPSEADVIVYLVIHSSLVCIFTFIILAFRIQDRFPTPCVVN